ncbi:MAG TPA: hypothetical protein VLI39_18625 [Sedimentisphaerales bacterium]|nr:hypothetical protein [Sedimentisphaerales bacterium]
MKALNLTVLLVMAVVAPAWAGNPLFEGWYADPEGIIIGDEYWVFPTYSAPYDRQLHLDAFSSNDLVTCMDRMYFDEQGVIQPIRITHEGVEKRMLSPVKRD